MDESGRLFVVIFDRSTNINQMQSQILNFPPERTKKLSRFLGRRICLDAQKRKRSRREERRLSRNRESVKERRADEDECNAAGNEGDYANDRQFDWSAPQITAVLTHSTKCTRKTGCLSAIRISRSNV